MQRSGRAYKSLWRVERTFRETKSTLEVRPVFHHRDDTTIGHIVGASWDLGHVPLVDDRTGVALSPLYPLDRAKNADGHRRRRQPVALDATRAEPPSSGMAPLLRKLMAQYAATGLPPAYLPTEDPR